MKWFFGIVVSLMFAQSLQAGCNSDYDCGYGNKCVKPQGSYSYRGNCVTPTDNYGNRDYQNSYNNWGSKATPHEVKGCSFDTQCPIGFSCMKQSGQIYGVCMK